jgi:NADH dehydrogenase
LNLKILPIVLKIKLGKMKRKPKVIIIGGGFGGLNAAKVLKNKDVDVTLIDKTNHHLFQPLLYQVATAALSPGDIAVPLRAILSNQKNVEVIMGEVLSVDRGNKKVHLRDESLEYDYLIIAAGASHSYFGNDHWANFAPGLKTVKDALTIRERILLSFEKAERLIDKENVGKYLTFVIVGGGPTGVEVAGAIAEISKKTMLKDFRKIDPSRTKIILAEGMPRILNTYDPDLSEKAKQSLEELGVDVRVNTFVTEITEDGVKLGDDFIETPNVIWGAGNEASDLLKSLNTKLDKIGRVVVEKDCSVPGDPYVFVIGDAAAFYESDDKTLPGVAPVAIQQGKYVAKIIAKNYKPSERPDFKYLDKGNLATIGRARAIMQLKNLKVSGFIAWLLWSLVHVFFLIGFRNRYKVMAEWIWYYITYRHGIRLITQKTDL